MTNIGKPERVYEIPDPVPVPDYPDFPVVEPEQAPANPDVVPEPVP